jgi:multidrug efflux pump subunit AcrB
MSLPSVAIENKTVTFFVVFLLLAGGIFRYFQLGQLEDPDFTIKTAVVITQYPGASPKEVEQEVTDRIETAIQQMPQLDNLYSFSKAGVSIIKVNMKQIYWADRLPQVWDEMRKKINNIAHSMPLGAGKPFVMDDFSFVYGFVLAVTGDGYSYEELQDHVDYLKKELSLVNGVSRAELWGEQTKVVYLDVSKKELSESKLTHEVFMASLASQNMVLNGGGLEVGGERYRIEQTGGFKTSEEIGDLLLRGSLLDVAQIGMATSTPKKSLPVGTVENIRSDELIALKDLVTVRNGYLEPPMTMMRFNGQQALAISLANVSGGNVVDTGRNLDKRLNELIAELPVGINVEKISWQSEMVSKSIDEFMINLAEAVLIVLVVLTLAMGWRMGIIIGSALILTILGTFIVMSAWGIALQRVSLGALVIALGMMVDNAIVVADGAVVRMKRGMGRKEAVIDAAWKPAWPLLGSTIVAVMAFYPIFAATTDVGEYARSLFVCVGIALVLSWLVALTITPLQCISLLPDIKEGGGDPYDGGFYRWFRNMLGGAVRHRVLTLAIAIALMVVAVIGFSRIDQMFFPDSTRLQFMIDYWTPEGTRIQTVSADLKPIEEKLLNSPGVKNVSTFVGAGGPRFYLPVDPELPFPSYGQLIVNTDTLEDVDLLVKEMEPWLKENFPQAMTKVRKYSVGPGNTWPLEARFSGPGDADLKVLRSLEDKGREILENNPLAKHVRSDMREPVKKVVTEYDQARARWSVVSRADLARSTKVAFDGILVGLFREGTDLLPIIMRFVEKERRDFPGAMDVTPVRPSLMVTTVPLGQVTADIRVESEDPIVVRWNRRRAVTVQAAPDNVTFPTLMNSVAKDFESIDLPPSYRLEWRGEAFTTKDAVESLIPGMVPSLVIILFIIILLFNAVRPIIIIGAAIPLGLIGITGGLLATGIPFGFMALLGAMSLVGMMIKNSIVLLDEINIEKATGKIPYDAIIQAAISRLKPVMLGAGTTVLGVAPLLQDVFWASMSVTIMAGLAFGTMVTMIIVPVLYATLFRIASPKPQKSEN